MHADSGATDTVHPQGFLPTHETQEAAASKSGNRYKAATGSTLRRAWHHGNRRTIIILEYQTADSIGGRREAMPGISDEDV